MRTETPERRGERTYRIFISSTAIDLWAHRAAVRETLARLGHFAVDMVDWGAAGHGDATSVSREKVATSDALVLIVAWRYGHRSAGQEKSVTHLEYDEARALDLPIFVYLADPRTEEDDGPGAIYPAAVRDPDPENRATLLAFRAELEARHIRDYFTTPDDLAKKVATDVGNWSREQARAEIERAQREPRPPRDLPPRVAEFVGRGTELATLCAGLRAGQSVGLSAAVAGMAGVGKSALAAEALHTLASEPDAFPGGIAWVRCDGREDLPGLTWIYDQLLGAWGVAVPPEAQAAAATPEAAAELRERALRARLRPLDDGPAQPALALLDNVERGLPVARALATLNPLGVTLLLTARFEPSAPGLRQYRLDVLDPDAALALFAERYAEKQGSWQADRDTAPAAEVVERLGRLPLAIELAAARAARARTSVAALAAELRDADRLGKLRDPLDPTLSVRYAFERSLHELTPEQHARFAALALPAGPDWPRPVIERMLAGVGANSDAGAASPADDLDALVALSLLTPLPPDDESPDPRLRLHPLLRELAEGEWRAQPEAARQAGIAALLAAVRDLVERHARDFARLSREEELIAGAIEGAATAHVEPRTLAATVRALFDYLNVGGHWRLGMRLLALQLDARRQTGDRGGEGTTLNNLGLLADDLGDKAAARAYYEQALAIYREVGDRGGEGTTLNNLGAVADDLGDKAAARAYYEQALAILERIGAVDSARVVRGNLQALGSEAHKRHWWPFGR
jgi:tetratricopeptide (TPR) repeat protein